MINIARECGFDNVHDYLVHAATGASPEELRRRKKSLPWGKRSPPGHFSSARAAAAAAAEATPTADLNDARREDRDEEEYDETRAAAADAAPSPPTPFQAESIQRVTSSEK